MGRAQTVLFRSNLVPEMVPFSCDALKILYYLLLLVH